MTFGPAWLWVSTMPRSQTFPDSVLVEFHDVVNLQLVHGLLAGSLHDLQADMQDLSDLACKS
jgi:hypothetical protein